MKLIQLNAYGGRLERQIPVLLKNEQPDFLCLQEIISFDGKAGMFLSLEDIQNQSGLEYSAIGPKFSFNYMDGVARFTNSILSRYPIQKSEVVFTGHSHIDDFSFNKYNRVDTRNFVHAVIDINRKPINVLTHHGHHIPEHKNGDAETTRQMNLLGDYIDRLKGPVILTGDFNLAPHSKSLNQINQRLQNLSIKNKLRTTRTALTHKTEVCDYIFINEDVKFKKFRALDNLVSDHKALVLEFDI